MTAVGLTGVVFSMDLFGDDLSLVTSTSSFTSLFMHRDSRERHLGAPKLQEREAYIAALKRVGFERKFILERSSLVIAVLEHAELGVDGFIGEAEIAAATEAWKATRTTKRHSSFVAAARSWYRFVGLYRPTDARGGRFSEALQRFTEASEPRGQGSPLVARAYSPPVACFLEWCSDRETLSSIKLLDVYAFLEEKRRDGWSARTTHNAASSLRSFFRYVELHGWSSTALADAIHAPTVRKRTECSRCPPWKQVRLMLDSLNCSNPSQCRAKAILLLATIYGLRRSEIARLNVDDFDWKGMVFTVCRSKGGRVQQFPLRPEVSEAITTYLREVRPKSEFPSLFLTLQKPYRPATNLGPAMRKIMSAQGTFTRDWGLHALRHACATELLRQGTSLRGIAELLGHRSLASVSIYAQCDWRALRRVAAIDLSAVL